MLKIYCLVEVVYGITATSTDEWFMGYCGQCDYLVGNSFILLHSSCGSLHTICGKAIAKSTNGLREIIK